jgi:hypothetical protein
MVLSSPPADAWHQYVSSYYLGRPLERRKEEKKKQKLSSLDEYNSIRRNAMFDVRRVPHHHPIIYPSLTMRNHDHDG